MADAISSTSKGWIEAVKRSGRYAGFNWNKKEQVDAITLGELIKKFGKPAFCKIDVEGSELDVLKGLSKPIRYISFEFSSDYLQNSMQCVRHLVKLGRARFNYSIGESMSLILQEWIDAGKLIDKLTRLAKESVSVSGDIYVRFDKKWGMNR